MSCRAPASVQDAPFRLARRGGLSPAVAEWVLAPMAEPVHFVSGQYVQLCDLAYRLPPRSHALAHAPRHDGHLRLLVTAVSGAPMGG